MYANLQNLLPGGPGALHAEDEGVRAVLNAAVAANPRPSGPDASIQVSGMARSGLALAHAHS